VTSRVFCVAYVSPGSATLDQTRRRYEDSTGVTRAGSTCFTDGQGSPGSERRIQVLVQRSGTIETGLWSRTVTLQQKVVYRYEVSNGL